MPAVTRIVAFKYKSTVTEERKKQVIDDLNKMFKHNEHRMIALPTGGKNISPEGHAKGFDLVLTFDLKSVEDRDNFIQDEHYTTLKETITSDLLDDYLVYEFIKGGLDANESQ